MVVLAVAFRLACLRPRIHRNNLPVCRGHKTKHSQERCHLAIFPRSSLRRGLDCLDRLVRAVRSLYPLIALSLRQFPPPLNVCGQLGEA